MLDLVGKYGNSSVHRIDDWIEVERDDTTLSDGTWKKGFRRCTFPAKAQINVFYHKIGSVNDPQHKILKVELTFDKQAEWVYVLPLPDTAGDS